MFQNILIEINLLNDTKIQLIDKNNEVQRLIMTKSEKTLLMIGKMEDIEIIELLKKDKRNIIEVVEYLSIDDLYRIWLRYYRK